jgi:5-oxoprolinase (ATP-hydrolysing)
MQNQYYFDFSIDRGGTFTDIYCEIIDHLGQNYKEVGKLLSEDPANY